MRIILIGANGTLGSAVHQMLKSQGAEVVTVGRKSGDHRVDITDRKQVSAFFAKIGKFDAVVNASGSVAFKPLLELNAEHWQSSLSSKLMGQIHLVQEAVPYINEKGSFTLISGVLSDEPIFSGVAATTVNRAVEGFVMAAAVELPKQLRINVVSPTVLTESMEHYASFFPGFIPVDAAKAAEGYKKSIYGVSTGQTFRVQ